MKSKLYTAKERGTCVPCSFINFLGLKGSLELEKKLSNAGRLKPFLVGNWTSFAIWAEMYKVNIEIFLTTFNLNKKMFELVQRYEGIPENKMLKYIKVSEKRYLRLRKKYAKKIIKIRDPLKKLDELLSRGEKVIFVVSSFYVSPKNPLPHSVVIYKKKGRKYFIMDSYSGFSTLSKSQIKRGLEINKKQGFYPLLVSIKR